MMSPKKDLPLSRSRQRLACISEPWREGCAPAFGGTSMDQEIKIGDIQRDLAPDSFGGNTSGPPLIVHTGRYPPWFMVQAGKYCLVA